MFNLPRYIIKDLGSFTCHEIASCLYALGPRYKEGFEASPNSVISYGFKANNTQPIHPLEVYKSSHGMKPDTLIALMSYYHLDKDRLEKSWYEPINLIRHHPSTGYYLQPSTILVEVFDYTEEKLGKVWAWRDVFENRVRLKWLPYASDIPKGQDPIGLSNYIHIEKYSIPSSISVYSSDLDKAKGFHFDSSTTDGSGYIDHPILSLVEPYRSLVNSWGINYSQFNNLLEYEDNCYRRTYSLWEKHFRPIVTGVS
jgi:hypothetical protein